MSENPFSLDVLEAKKATTSPKGERPAQASWPKRWLAHLADVLIVAILGIVFYTAAVMPIIEATTDFNAQVSIYQNAQSAKIGFLQSMGIMKAKEGGNQSESDSDMFLAFATAYLNDQPQSDPMRIYYTQKAKDLTPYNPETAKDQWDSRFETTSVPKALDDAGYNALLEKQFNTDSQKVFEDGKLTDEDSHSARFLLATYTGIGLKPGEGKEVFDENASFYAAMMSNYTTLRQSAAMEALSSLQEMPTEIALVTSYDRINRLRSLSAILSYVLAFVLGAFPYFRYGRTIGKRVLGFYVIDRDDRKAAPWQLMARMIVHFFEYFWAIAFTLFFVFGLDALNAPFIGSVTYWIPLTVSLCLAILSGILSFAIKPDMLSLADVCSHTRVISLEPTAAIQDILAKKEN